MSRLRELFNVSKEDWDSYYKIKGISLVLGIPVTIIAALLLSGPLSCCIEPKAKKIPLDDENPAYEDTIDDKESEESQMTLKRFRHI